MKIICPHCNFSREVPDEKIPDRPVKVTCPKCQQGFSFDKAATLAANAFDADFAETPQPSATSEDAAGDWAETASQAPPYQAPPFPGRAAYAAVALPADLPKAGFWVRVLACGLDSLILGAVQFVIGLVLSLAGGAAGDFEGGGSFVLFMITWLCSVVISITYYVFFTGYNGQTPGKMALRIQVVRSDGSPMSYGRAFLREIPAKFLSALILGIGYLMVAFDRQKQGLHDRIAGTYVIKL